MEIPVFVINLKRSIERRKHTSKQLNELGVSFQIVEAFDGVELTDKEIRDNPDFGIYQFGIHSGYLRKEEIGCTLSHLKIYQHIVDENILLACILEDDNNYSKEFKDLLVNENLYKVGWDILYLGHHSGCSTKEARSRRNELVIPLNYSIGEAIEVPYGSYAYIIRIEAAKKLLDSAYPIKMPCDSYIGNAPAMGITAFLLTPPCAVNNSQFKSTIYYGQKVVSSSGFWKRLDYLINKIYLLLPFLRTFRIFVFKSYHSIQRYLRKTGIIKNNYAKY